MSEDQDQIEKIMNTVEKFINGIEDLNEGHSESSLYRTEEQDTIVYNLRLIFILIRVRIMENMDEVDLESRFYRDIDSELWDKLASRRFKLSELKDTIERFKVNISVNCRIGKNRSNNEPGRDSE